MLFDNNFDVYSYMNDNKLVEESIGLIRGNMFSNEYKTYKNYNPVKLDATTEKDALLIQGGIPIKIVKEPFNKYFDKEHIFNLEGLIYFYSLLYSNKSYDELLHDIRVKMLDTELNESAYLYHYRNFMPLAEPNKTIRELRSNIDKLSKLAYPLSIENIKNVFDKIAIDTTFHTGSDENQIKFCWKTDINHEQIVCYYKNVSKYQMMVIDYVHGENSVETISYVCNYGKEVLEYMPSDKKHTMSLDITNDLLDSYDATLEDYYMFNQIITKYINVILDRLPYLAKPYTEEINNRQKKK